MANKRQKKKQETLKKKKILESKGIGKKEQKKLPQKELDSIIASELRKEKQRKRYAEKKKQIKKYNLNIKPTLSWAKINEEIEAKTRQAKLTPTERRKKEWLDEKKISYKRSDLKRPWKEVYQLFEENERKKGSTKIYKADEMLYVGFADNAKEIDILREQRFYNSMTVKQLKDRRDELMVIDAYRERHGGGGSSGRSGDVHLYSLDPGFMRSNMVVIRDNEKRGYQTIMTDEFTLHGILKLEVCLLENTREDLREPIHNHIDSYLKNNLPELHLRWK